MLSQREWEILACPDCGGAVMPVAEGARCGACETTYITQSSGALDLRPRRTRRCVVEIDYPTRFKPEPTLFRPLRSRDYPSGRVAGFPRRLSGGNRLSRELVSHFPRAASAGGIMLDIGCGEAHLGEICRDTNLEYLGMDYESNVADVLGDAHLLPIRSASVDFILSLAVLEHLQFPQLALQEAFRVLKPGAWLIGTVAFLEPFHMNSFFHHSHLGTASALASAGFLVQQVAPNEKWTGLRALASMSLFPQFPRGMTDLITLPLTLMHRLWLQVEQLARPGTGRNQQSLNLWTTGGFQFIALKPALHGETAPREPDPVAAPSGSAIPRPA